MKIFPRFVAAVALFTFAAGGPAFGFDKKDDGKKDGGKGRAAQVAVTRGGGGGVRTSSAPKFTAGPTVRNYQAGRSYHVPVAANRSFSGGNSVSYARGGGSGRSYSYVRGGGSSSGRQFAFRSHDGWNHDRDYYWHGHHYGWYDGAWFILDPYPGYYAGDYYPYYSTDYYGGYHGGGPVAAQVQSALSEDGYYDGPVDGIIGPRTSAAIAAYQRDNGLRVTGSITRSLLASMGIG